MLQLADSTPFTSTLSLLPNAKGIDTLYVIVKATFALGAELAVADEQQPVHLADVFFGEPGHSSLKYASEIHLTKPNTDVALVGSATVPGGKKVEELTTLLSVGPLRKSIQVVGEQEWTGRLVGSAKGPIKPFSSLPLTYERAYGGVHVMDEEKGKVKSVDENPVGSGFRVRQRRQDLKGTLAPSCIDPEDEKRPAGYGFIAPSWKPRATYAGTYDDAWQQNRAPYLPQDFNSRFFNAAHPDLIAPGYLKGGEPVLLKNLSAQGTLRFRLPMCEFKLDIRLDRKNEQPELNLETVLFETDEDRMTMTWRAELPCDKKALKVESVEVGLGQMLLNGKAV